MTRGEKICFTLLLLLNLLVGMLFEIYKDELARYEEKRKNDQTNARK